MRIANSKPAAAVGAACLTMLLAGAAIAQQLDLKVLSGRPDMVSGGSALVQISGPSLESPKVQLNGRLIPATTFRPGPAAGILLGRVEGLQPGSNLLQVGDG